MLVKKKVTTCYVGWGDITPKRMENHMKKTMENEIETGIIHVLSPKP